MKKVYLLLFTLVVSFYGCEKFLDEKPDKKDVIPQTLIDLQALLDWHSKIRINPAAGEISADNYFLQATDWEGFYYEEDRRIYVWRKDRVCTSSEWLNTYRNVKTANLILEELENIERDTNNQHTWDDIKGQALFLRARSFLSIAVIWAAAYDKETASTDLGIPLRLNSNFNEPSVRSNIRETYTQIIDDLLQAAELLPTTPVHVLRASEPAALGLLARTYLFMHDYENCFQYANQCLKIRNTLLDYSTLDKDALYPIPQFNAEVIYASWLAFPKIAAVKIDTVLFKSFDENDLRKVMLFRKNGDGTYNFKGSYTGNAIFFSGLAVDEVLLMRAECYARSGDANAAMNDLNALLSNRWKQGRFIPISASSSDEALRVILKERRKELLFRGLRWPDIKRLNKEGANIKLKRIINGEEYFLSPNDPRFALAIPEEVIERSGMTQNFR